MCVCIAPLLTSRKKIFYPDPREVESARQPHGVLSSSSKPCDSCFQASCGKKCRWYAGETHCLSIWEGRFAMQTCLAPLRLVVAYPHLHLSLVINGALFSVLREIAIGRYHDVTDHRQRCLNVEHLVPFAELCRPLCRVWPPSTGLPIAWRCARIQKQLVALPCSSSPLFEALP